MNAEGFVMAIRRILSAAMSGLLRNIQDPPGRKPSPKLLRISEFCKKLDERDSQIFREALELAARQSINNFLLVLDGSLAIESGEQKGKLELYYVDGTLHTRLNDPEEDPLNEIFRRTDD